MKTRIVAEASRLNPSGNGLESGLNAKENLNSGDWWCDHHKIATHNTADCCSYQSWVKGLQEGKGKRGGKKGDKSNVAETPPDSGPSESAHVTSVTDRPVLPRPYQMILRGGVTVLEGAGILARGTGFCT